MEDLTVSEDYELARRYNDAIDLAYVHARRAIKRHYEELCLLQGRSPARGPIKMTLALTAMYEAYLRTPQLIEARDGMEERHEAERKALASRQEAERVAQRELRFRVLLEQNDRVRREQPERVAELEGLMRKTLHGDPFHDGIAAEQEAEKRLLRGEG